MSFGQVTYLRAAVGKANQILHRKFEPCPEQSHVLRFGGLRVEVGLAFSIRAAMGDRPWIVGHPEVMEQSDVTGINFRIARQPLANQCQEQWNFYFVDVMKRAGAFCLTTRRSAGRGGGFSSADQF